MNTLTTYIFSICLLVILIASIINLIIVKKLTKYLKEKYPEKFIGNKLPQTSYEASAYTPNNLIRLHILPFQILLTKRFHIDEISTRYAKISRFLYLIVIIVGVLLIGYILTETTTENLFSQ